MRCGGKLCCVECVRKNGSFRPIADIRDTSHNSSMSSASRYAGMTVNERLFEAGLIEMFDDAARSRDRAEMVRLLTKVDVEDAASSADTILKDPQRYGYW
jgi:hypothetical protein